MENCRCGKTPILQKRSVEFGHGSNGYEYYIECLCGMQTRAVANYSKCESECIKEVETIWNKWAK